MTELPPGEEENVIGCGSRKHGRRPSVRALAERVVFVVDM